MNWKPLILLLSFSTAALTVEDPANCSLANGGLGNTSFGGLNFNVSRAHLGDTVSLLPSLGMAVGACKSINTTGSIYIATGFLTNFMQNVTLDPDGIHTCPADGLCEPGPYSFVVTAPMVGAGVSSPLGSLSGIANLVRAIENGVGTVLTDPEVELIDFHSASTLVIVTPCIQVFKTCGISCIGSNLVNFTGYVTNCGDITLTNVTVVDDRTNTLYNLDDSPLSQPLTLTNGQAVQFKGSFIPSGSETNTATNSITATGKDTTTIGGPSSSVTNTVTVICSITSCNNCGCPCFGSIVNDTIIRNWCTLELQTNPPVTLAIRRDWP